MSSNFGTFLCQLLMYSFLLATCVCWVGTTQCQDCPLGYYWRCIQNLWSLPIFFLSPGSVQLKLACRSPIQDQGLRVICFLNSTLLCYSQGVYFGRVVRKQIVQAQADKLQASKRLTWETASNWGWGMKVENPVNYSCKCTADEMGYLALLQQD